MLDKCFDGDSMFEHIVGCIFTPFMSAQAHIQDQRRQGLVLHVLLHTYGFGFEDFAQIKIRVAAPSADAGPLNSTSCNALRDQGGVGPSGLQRRDLHVRLNLGFNFSPCVRQLASVMFRSSGTLRLKTLLCSTLNPSWIASASSRFTCKCQLLSSFHLIKLMWFLLAQACPLPHVGNGRPVPPLARSRIPPLKMSRFYEQADYTLKSIGKRSSSRSSAINSPDLAMQQHLNAFLYHRVSGPPDQAR